MLEALTEAAIAIISSALSPRTSFPPSQPTGTSPAKLIEPCSKCCNDLKSSGIIPEDEYTEEKESVISLLRKN